MLILEAGEKGTVCRGEPAQIIPRVGSIATLRWDGATNVGIKNFSLREIQPPSRYSPAHKIFLLFARFLRFSLFTQ